MVLSFRRSLELVIRFSLTFLTTASITVGTSNFLLMPISSRAQVMAALGSRRAVNLPETSNDLDELVEFADRDA